MVFIRILNFVFFCLLFSQCSTYQVSSIQYHSYSISDSVKTDLTSDTIILAYKKQLDTEMQRNIVFAKADLFKKQPESELGNFMATVCKERAEEELNKEVDLAILNYGGIRIRSISKAWVRTAQVYELMPFQNFIVLQEIRGDTLQMLLNQVASYGGWPISGASFQINNSQADSVKIGESPIEMQKHYQLATTDYLANGGDKMVLLQQLRQEQTGILLRDALIDYCIAVNRQGDSLDFKIDGRIVVK